MTSRPLTRDEIKQMASVIVNTRDRCLFLLGVYTGFRISELLSITSYNVAHKGTIRDSLTVARRQMKGKWASRTVPLHAEVRLALQEYLGDLSSIVDRPLFPFSRMQAHRIIRSAVTKCGIKGRVSSNSMRKAFGMKVYKATGNDIVAAQRALGHKSLSSTTHYLSVNQDIVDMAILGD